MLGLFKSAMLRSGRRSLGRIDQPAAVSRLSRRVQDVVGPPPPASGPSLKLSKGLKGAGLAYGVMSVAAGISAQLYNNDSSLVGESLANALACAIKLSPKSIASIAISKMAAREPGWGFYIIALQMVLNGSHHGPASEEDKSYAGMMILAAVDPDEYANIKGEMGWWETVVYHFSYWENYVLNTASAGYLGSEDLNLADIIDRVDEDEGLRVLGKFVSYCYFICKRLGFDIDKDTTKGDYYTDPVGDIIKILQHVERMITPDLPVLGVIKETADPASLIGYLAACDPYFRAVVLEAYVGERASSEGHFDDMMNTIDRHLARLNEVRDPVKRLTLVQYLQEVADMIASKIDW